jgi:hypothetical protein
MPFHQIGTISLSRRYHALSLQHQFQTGLVYQPHMPFHQTGTISPQRRLITMTVSISIYLFNVHVINLIYDVDFLLVDMAEVSDEVPSQSDSFRIPNNPVAFIANPSRQVPTPSLIGHFASPTTNPLISRSEPPNASAGPMLRLITHCLSDSWACMTSFRAAASIIAADEERGFQHVVRAEQSAEDSMPIADDDWEAYDPSDADDTSGFEEECANAGTDTMDDDQFQYPPPPVIPPPTAADVHPNPAVYLIYLLVLWLHTQFHLAFRACSVVLIVVSLAFTAAGTPIQPEMYTTLPSVIKALDAEASMKIYPVCPNCLKVYLSSVPSDMVCERCAHPLFSQKPTPVGKQRSASQGKAQPYLQFPSKSIEEHLSTILAIPGVEDEMEAWRNKIRTAGKLTDIFDGKICQMIPGIDGSRFFFPREGTSELGELRIGVSLGADWYCFFWFVCCPLN